MNLAEFFNQFSIVIKNAASVVQLISFSFWNWSSNKENVILPKNGYRQIWCKDLLPSSIWKGLSAFSTRYLFSILWEVFSAIRWIEALRQANQLSTLAFRLLAGLHYCNDSRIRILAWKMSAMRFWQTWLNNSLRFGIFLNNRICKLKFAITLLKYLLELDCVKQ